MPPTQGHRDPPDTERATAPWSPVLTAAVLAGPHRAPQGLMSLPSGSHLPFPDTAPSPPVMPTAWPSSDVAVRASPSTTSGCSSQSVLLTMPVHWPLHFLQVSSKLLFSNSPLSDKLPLKFHYSLPLPIIFLCTINFHLTYCIFIC